MDINLVDALTSAQRVTARSLAERLAEEDAGVDQWRVLRVIGASAGVAMGSLAEQVQIPAPSLTRLVDSLVDRALVYRRQSVTDRRRIDVHLSENGHKLLGRLESIAADHQAAMQQRLGRDALSAMITFLEAIQEEYARPVSATPPGEPASLPSPV